MYFRAFKLMHSEVTSNIVMLYFRICYYFALDGLDFRFFVGISVGIGARVSVGVGVGVAVGVGVGVSLGVGVAVGVEVGSVEFDIGVAVGVKLVELDAEADWEDVVVGLEEEAGADGEVVVEGQVILIIIGTVDPLDDEFGVGVGKAVSRTLILRDSVTVLVSCD